MAVLSHQSLVKVIRGKEPLILGNVPISDDQIQMASLDLSLGTRVYGMRASGLPRSGQSIQNWIDANAKTGYAFNLGSADKILTRRQTYIVQLNESLRLPAGFSARYSPKSSTGRVDVLVRVLADGTPHFDTVLPKGYRGPLYLEITPLSFDILLQAGQPLVQMRIRHGESWLTREQVHIMQSERGLVWGKDGRPIHPDELVLSERGAYMHVDLDRKIVGFVARDPAAAELSLAKKDAYDIEQFFTPILRPRDGMLTLNPGQFYLLATKERVKVPPEVCGDIASYDPTTGEYRPHYAGFFDPGFGGASDDDVGTVGVMEVRGRELPFILQDGQPICRMDFERMDEMPDILYGAGGGHYTGPGPSLGKFFRNRREAWEE